jgi:hypothetical protein
MPADANCFDSTSYLSCVHTCTHGHSTAQHSCSQHKELRSRGTTRQPASGMPQQQATECTHYQLHTLITIVLHVALCVSSSLTDPSFL